MKAGYSRLAGAALLIAALSGGCGEKKPAGPPPETAAERSARVIAGWKYRQARLDQISIIISSPPRSDYERTVQALWTEFITPEIEQQICSQWFPDHGRKVAEGFVAWRDRNATALRDVDAHATAIWLSNAGKYPESVAHVRNTLRKQMVEEMMTTFDANPIRKFELECVGYPQVLASANWDLEKRRKRDLATIRAHPLAAATL